RRWQIMAKLAGHGSEAATVTPPARVKRRSGFGTRHEFMWHSPQSELIVSVGFIPALTLKTINWGGFVPAIIGRFLGARGKTQRFQCQTWCKAWQKQEMCIGNSSGRSWGL